jgi:hypothetical protein
MSDCTRALGWRSYHIITREESLVPNRECRGEPQPHLPEERAGCGAPIGH